MGAWFEDEKQVIDVLQRVPRGELSAPKLAGYTVLGPPQRASTDPLWRVHCARTGATYAARRLHPCLRQGEIQVQLARHSAIQHPGICRWIEVIRRGRERWLIQESNGSVAVDEHLPCGPRSLHFTTAESWVGLVLQVGDVVQAAHEHGVRHGDLRVRHLSLDERGQCRVDGFGLQPASGSAARCDAGEPQDLRGLGALLYAGLTGEAAWPHHGARRGSDVAPPGSVRQPIWDARLEGIVMLALGARRGSRYASVAEFLYDLTAWLQHRRPMAPRYGWTHRLAWHLRQGLRLRSADSA